MPQHQQGDRCASSKPISGPSTCACIMQASQQHSHHNAMSISSAIAGGWFLGTAMKYNGMWVNFSRQFCPAHCADSGLIIYSCSIIGLAMQARHLRRKNPLPSTSLAVRVAQSPHAQACTLTLPLWASRADSCATRASMAA